MFLRKQKTAKKYVRNIMKSKINKYQYHCKLIICVDYNNRDFRYFLVYDFVNMYFTDDFLTTPAEN